MTFSGSATAAQNRDAFAADQLRQIDEKDDDNYLEIADYPARARGVDYVLADTAGRLHVDRAQEVEVFYDRSGAEVPIFLHQFFDLALVDLVCAFAADIE